MPAIRRIAWVLSNVGSASLLGYGRGGGGGSSPLPEPTSQAEGIWSGTASDGRYVTGIALNDNSFYVLYLYTGSAGYIAGMVQSNGTLVGSSLSSNNVRDFSIQYGVVASTTLSATVAPRVSLNGTLSSTTFTTAYNTAYDVAPSLSAVAGTYTGNVAMSLGVQAAIVTVGTGGTISGGGNGCSISGTVAPHVRGNVYDVSVTFGSSPCYFAGQTFTGIAYYDTPNKALYAFAPNAARTDGCCSPESNRNRASLTIRHTLFVFDGVSSTDDRRSDLSTGRPRLTARGIG